MEPSALQRIPLPLQLHSTVVLRAILWGDIPYGGGVVLIDEVSNASTRRPRLLMRTPYNSVIINCYGGGIVSFPCANGNVDVFIAKRAIGDEGAVAIRERPRDRQHSTGEYHQSLIHCF